MPRDLIHLMHALFLPAARRLEQVPWSPPVDVYQTRTGWLVKFDLAGVRTEDIRLAARGRRLRLEGCRRDTCVAEGHCHYHMEIAYNCFERSLELPCDLDQAHITTEYRDGMLLVRIRTEEEAQP